MKNERKKPKYFEIGRPYSKNTAYIGIINKKKTKDIGTTGTISK